VKRQVFDNDEDLNFCLLHGQTLAQNLASIPEGITVLHINEASQLGPFILFSCDSGGDLTLMLCLSDFEQVLGDVIVIVDPHRCHASTHSQHCSANDSMREGFV
jgi:hypothetical protein